jgi:hypothetical protein
MDFGAGVNAADVKQAQKELSRVVTALVAIRDTCYTQNMAYKAGKRKTRADPVAEDLATRLKTRVASFLAEACYSDKSFKAVLPRAIGIFGPSCIEYVDGPDGGFQNWRARMKGRSAFGVILVDDLVILAVIGGIAFASWWFSTKNSGAGAVALKEAELVEKYMRCLETKGSGSADCQEMKKAVDKLPEPPKDWMESLSDIVLWGGFAAVVIFLGPKILDRFPTGGSK